MALADGMRMAFAKSPSGIYVEADPSKAGQLLGWKAEKTLLDMCRDCWRYAEKNL